MKRLGLIAVLLLAGAVNAHADNDALHVDTAMCDAQFGAPQNGAATSREYKRCMLGRGWRFSRTVRERTTPNRTYPDPDDPGLMCRDFTIGGITGSSCSNF